MTTDDMALLREYALRNSEEAFAALVLRHVNLVYSVALLEVHDPHLAEEITQAVFIILARKATSIGPKVILGGWLCRTARYASANALTIQRRRQEREQEAYMLTILNESEPADAWTQIAPLLSGAMEQLGPKEYDAVVLRFFEGKSFQEIGTALGASENAAKKRVAYTLEKLRKFFLKHGITSTTAALAVALSTNSVQSAPVTLAKAATTVALAKGATASTSTLMLVKGALKIMAWTKAKTAIVVGVAAILAVGTTTTLIVHHNRQESARTDFPRSSWKNAGYSDPVSAFETAFWATSQNDGKTILASLTPDLLQKLKLSLSRGNLSPEEFLSQDEYSAGRLNGVTGFHVVKSEVVSDNEIRLRLSIDGKQGEQTFTMKKFGGGWKMNDFPAGF